MLSCLTEQLLSHPSVHPYYDSASVDKRMLKRLKKKYVEVLCTVFRMLIEQLLPSNMVVFCPIDVIPYCEVGLHRAHIRIILALMRRLVRSQRGRRRGSHHEMRFKLIVTDEASSLEAYKHFGREQTVDIVDGGNGSNLLELGAKC